MTRKIERWRTLRQLEAWLETPMLLLSLLWLVIILVDLVYGSGPMLNFMASAIWVIFILEFALRLVLAPDKSAFFKRNWLTAISLIVPALRLFRALAILRAARALRGLRLLRIIGTANRSMNALRATLRRRRFGYVGVLTLLVAVLGAAGMLNFEPAGEVEGGFTSYWDALWWTGMLLTSIGSQFWPLTTEGRVLSFLLSLYGLAVLGYLTATFASFFIGHDAEDPAAPTAGSAELAELEREVRALRQAIERSQRTGA